MRLGTIMTLLAGLSLTSCGGEEQMSEPVLRPVRYMTFGAAAEGRAQTYSGVAQAGEQARLSFRIAGMLSSLDVHVGDTVRAGQLIAAMDPSDHQIQLSAAQAAVGQARAQERSAGATYARVRALYENNSASRQELDSARAASETSAASVRSAAQRARLVRQQIEYCRLEAPAAGTISAVNVEVNENASPGQVIAVLQNGEQLEVHVAVPGSIISRIERGVAVQVAFSDVADRSFAGTVFEVGVSTARGSTYPVTVRLNEQDEALRSGMSADVTFELQEPEGEAVTRVPSVAVGEDAEGRFVWVVEVSDNPERGTVSRRAVTIGDISSEGLAIVDGLTEGDVVVTAGVSRIRHGVEVRLLPRWGDGPSPQGAANAQEDVPDSHAPPAGE